MTAALVLTAAVLTMLHHATPMPVVLAASLVATVAAVRLGHRLDTRNGDLT